MSGRFRCIFFVAVLSAGPLVMGCAKNGAYTVRLTMDEESLRNKETGQLPSFEVDIAGINESEAGKWSVFSSEEYFEANNQFRADADAFTASFTESDHGPKILKKGSQHWKRWKKKGATQLYLIGHLPRLPAETPEAANARRTLILPLDKKSWKSSFFSFRKPSLRVLIQQTGLITETQQRP